MKLKPVTLLLILFFSFAAQVQSQSYFKAAPTNYTAVNDYAGMLSTVQRKALSLKMEHFLSSTGNVAVIITQNSLTDGAGKKYSIDEAALNYFNQWKIGNKDKNNGVLIFVAKEDRQVRISTGSEIENILTNNDCKEIIEGSIVPEFRAKKYYAGLDKALSAIMKLLTDPANAASEK